MSPSLSRRLAPAVLGIALAAAGFVLPAPSVGAVALSDPPAPPVPHPVADAEHQGELDVTTSLTDVGTASPATVQTTVPRNQRVAGSVVAVGASSVLSNESLAAVAYATDRTSSRLAGADRFQTAVAASRSQYPNGAAAAFISTGLDFPDALAAGPYAGQLKAPLLLTRSGSLDQPTLAELVRLSPAKVYIAGGVSVVSDTVVSQVQQALPGATVTRVQGQDRFATAAALSRTFVTSSTAAFVATAYDFPDALSVTPAAAVQRGPLLLSQPGSLPVSSADELRRLRPATTYVIGGPDVVSNGVVADIARTTGGDVIRIAGPDRFATSAAIADKFFTATTPSLILARAFDFPDALAGGALAGVQASPLLLNPDGPTPARVEIDAARRVSWWLPAQGRVLRYVPIAHPDDEMSSRSVLSPADPRRYDVYILLTRGEYSGYCNGQPLTNEWADIEFVPQPQPRGLQLSDRCKSHRLQSWNEFLDRSGMGSTPSTGIRLTGGPVTVDGRTIPTPTHTTESGDTAPADYFDAYIGTDSARIVFDLGTLTPDRVRWALETVRQHRDLLPPAVEGDVVGAGYHNTSGIGFSNEHQDHAAIYDLLRTTDLGLPGSQMTPVGHGQQGRVFGATVPDYCAMMCHPALIDFYSRAPGDMQYAYGWLDDGVWPAGELDVYAGFSRYQSFAKWY